MFFNRNHTRTPFVQLDTQKCEACWRCIESCATQIISKVDLPWHKHALIVKPTECTGCLNCVNICKHGAYSIYNREKQETEKIKYNIRHAIKYFV
jgi:2-oxoglutarate ferredoxin oxidoreductase subunit delta